MTAGPGGELCARLCQSAQKPTSWACGTASGRSRSARPHLRRAFPLTTGPPRSSIKLRGRGYPGNPGFVLCALVAAGVSLAWEPPDPEVVAEFERAVEADRSGRLVARPAE